MAERPALYAEILNEHCLLYYHNTQPKRIDDYVENSAKRIHSLMIWDASQNAFFQAVMLGEKLQNQTAHYYVQFGVARRLEMIWYAFRNLFSTAPPDRSEPLESEESRQLMVDINVIYLNIRGALDNMALSLLYEFDTKRASSLPPRKVSLFLPSVRSNPIFKTLTTIIEQHDAWDRDLKERRDPVAHRIPLSLPPSFLSSEESIRYQDLDRDHNEALLRRDFEAADAILSRQRRLGKFHPVFAHDPAEGLISIYPTVPDDIAHLVQIFDVVLEFLQRNKDSPSP